MYISFCVDYYDLLPELDQKGYLTNILCRDTSSNDEYGKTLEVDLKVTSINIKLSDLLTDLKKFNDSYTTLIFFPNPEDYQSILKNGLTRKSRMDIDYDNHHKGIFFKPFNYGMKINSISVIIKKYFLC